MIKMHFDIDGWMHFLASFDPIVEHSWVNEFRELDAVNRERNQILAHTAYIQESPHPALPQEDSPSPLAMNLANIYGEGSIRNWDFINAYRNALNNIVVRYIGIEGFEQLFSAYYFRFEWLMHVTPDFIKGNNKLYRDHFLHQAKNAWMGYEYLHRFGWMDYVTGWLENNPQNTIVEHINRAIREETLCRLERDARDPNHPISKIVEIYTKALLSVGTNDVAKAIQRCLHVTPEGDFSQYPPEEQRCFVLSALVRLELIQTTWFIASLLHDIGYPVQYMRDQNREIAKYMPSMDGASFAGEQSYDRMQRLLRNSLLYKVVQEVDLREGFTKNSHGTVSALVMLNQFYQQSTVHGNSPLKQCAVDWAAVCIQQHTQSFQASSGKSDDRYILDEFKNNALGYLLRLVDDLQEYDRFYFEIGRSHTLLFCSVCNQPLIHDSRGDSDPDAMYARMRYYPNIDLNPNKLRSGSNKPLPSAKRFSRYNELMPHSYHCLCRPWLSPESYRYGAISQYTGESFFPVEQLRTFDYRKVNTLVICREVTIELAAGSKELQMYDGSIDRSMPISAYIRYDPWAMLMLLQINPRFLMNRIKGVNETKRMLRNQPMLPTQIVRFFATVNPLWLKAEILYRWLVAPENLQKLIDKLNGDEQSWIDNAISNNGKDDLQAAQYDKLAQAITDVLEEDLCYGVYLSGSMCQGCERSIRKCFLNRVCAGDESKTQRSYYDKLKKKYPFSASAFGVKKADIRCPAAQNAYRVTWRIRYVYAPMLLGYLVVQMRAKSPTEATCWKRTNGCFDSWYLKQAEALCDPSGKELNREVAAFMMDFRERSADLWYWLARVVSITNADNVYLRQYEYLASQKKATLKGKCTANAEKHEYLKWSSKSLFEAQAECMETYMEEDAIRDVMGYVDNRRYAPYKYFEYDAETDCISPEWREIDFFSDLKLILTAHRYNVTREEISRDEEIKSFIQK